MSSAFKPLFLSAILLTAAWPSVVRAQPDDPSEAPAQPAGPQLTRAPELIDFVEAEYPPDRKEAGEQAAVVLKILISETGTVTEIEVAESGGEDFDAAAIAAVSQFRFSPAEFDGVPAPVRIFYRYEFTLKQELPTTADFSGVVRNRAGKQPLAGVELTIGDQNVTTDETGRFSFTGLPAGPHTIGIQGPGITPLRTEETLEAGQALDVVYDVSVEDPDDDDDGEDDLELVVVAPPLKKSIASVQIAADQGRRVAGTQGDVLKVVENMPGVARAAVGSGALVVWGAAPQDTRVYVDGVRIPVLYHMGGLRSVMATDFVSSIEVVPGGYSASYGRGLGGLVSITTQGLEKDGKGTRGVAAVDVIDAQVGVRTDINENTRAALFLRRSHLIEAFDAVSDRDVGDLVPLPRFWDGQARLRFDLAERESVSVTGLFSTDSVVRRVGTGDPAFDKSDERQLTFYRLSAQYENILGNGESVIITPWFGRDHARTENRFGSVPAILESETTLFGLRGAYRVRPYTRLSLTVGVDAEFEQISLQRQGSVSMPPREGDIRLFGQPTPDLVNFDDWSATILSPATFIEGELDVITDRLKLLPGLRVSPFMLGTSRITPPIRDAPPIGLYKLDTAIEPRLTARLQVTENWTVNAAWGFFRQPASGEDLSATFGTPSLPLARGTHYVLGSALKLTQFFSFELTGFASRTDRLAMRNALEAPQLAQALLPVGEGRAHGVQAMLRADGTGKFFGWVSYSLLRSERQDHPEARTRLFDFDQTHILTVVGSYQLGAGFELGSRFRLSSGFPRTPVVGRSYDSRRDIYQPIFGLQNSIRLPTFAQLDVRLSRRMKVAGTELELYLDVQNVTNRENGEEYVFSSDLTERRTIRGLPVLPVAGVRWEW